MRAKITKRLVDGLKPKRNVLYEVCDTVLPGFRIRVMPSGEKSYCALYRLSDGKRGRMRIGNVNMLSVAQARDQAKLILRDVDEGQDPAEKKRTARSETLRQFLDTRYGAWLKENRKAGAYILERLTNGCESLLDKRLVDINAWAIEQWRRDYMKRKALVTCNRHLSYLRAALERAVEWRIIKENPLSGVKKLKVDNARHRQIRTLGPDEEQKLWGILDTREERLRQERNTANTWRRERGYDEFHDLQSTAYADFVKPLITVALHCGLRRGELFSLLWSDVDLKAKSVTVRAESAKSGKTRVIPLNDAAHECLSSWHEQVAGDIVFPSPQGGGHLTTIKTVWAHLTSEAGIAGLRLHDLRHTFCSRLLQSGADLQTVRELAGHSDIATTAGYLHSDTTAKKSAVARLAVLQSITVSLEEAKKVSTR